MNYSHTLLIPEISEKSEVVHETKFIQHILVNLFFQN